MNTIVMKRQMRHQSWQQQGGVIRYAIYVTLFALFGFECKYLFFCFLTFNYI